MRSARYSPKTRLVRKVSPHPGSVVISNPVNTGYTSRRQTTANVARFGRVIKRVVMNPY